MNVFYRQAYVLLPVEAAERFIQIMNPALKPNCNILRETV